MRRKTTAPRKSKEPAVQPLPEGPLTIALAAATVIDGRLVDEAERWIRRKTTETVQRGLFEIGEYLFEKFYDRDPERVRSTDPRRHVSFRALTERCESVDLPVSKTTLYNAVSVAMMARLLGHEAAAFKQLPATHQATLLPLKDPAKVEKLAQRALTKELTVRELREIVGAEISIRDTEGPARGRPPLPVVLKGLRAASRNLREDGGRMGWTKPQIDELDADEAREAKRLAESMIAALQKLAERLEEV